jgi:Abnormal spindle-like microcephaly-assoc'd, ASPM-SPD-2-Hydin
MTRYLRRLALALIIVLFGMTATPLVPASAQAQGPQVSSSSPPDKTIYSRPVAPEDLSPLGSGVSLMGALVPAPFLRDPIMSNPSPNGSGGSEPSIAINPSNPNQIIVAAGFGGWNGNARLFYSIDGGNTWTTRFTIPAPPNGAGTSGCPCDQTFDYDRSGRLYGTFLANQVYSGGTTDPTSVAAWTWTTTGSPATAVTTNQAAQTSVDQPWLLVNRDPANAAQDNVYVAYDDFTINPGVPMRVAESTAGLPLNFTRNVQTSGATSGPGNPGHRLANDRSTGLIYDLWSSGAGGNNFSYLLNRSNDGGQTWSLNGSATGITVVTSPSNFGGKFGTVNALLGGVDHAAVDPITGSVYVVYGALDGGGNNRLAIARLQYNGTGTLSVVSTANVTTQAQVQAALPSVAVTDNGVVGVLYTTFDGFSSLQDPNNPGNFFPIFSAHFAASTDLGLTFNDTTMETFLSPATSTNPGDSQRVLGDFQQVKAVGDLFYGVFSGNGAPFGTTSSQIDPIFFKVSAAGPQITVTGDLNFGTVAQGTFADRQVQITNTGNAALVINGVGFAAGSDPSFSVLPNPGVPQTLQPSDSITYIVRFAPPTGTLGGTRNGTLVINSNDPLKPVVNVAATGVIGLPKVGFSSTALSFGAVPVDDRTNPHSADQVLTIFNQASCGGCDLTLLSLPITGPNAADFTVVGPTSLPTTVGAGSSLSFTIRFNPSGGGTRSATLTVNTNDPTIGSQGVSLSGTGLLSAISASPDPLIFGPTVLDPACGGVCGQTQNEVITNSGAAELILDVLTFSGDPAFSGPGPTSPLTRVQPTNSFNEPVTFHPIGTTPSYKLTGTLTVQHNVAGAAPPLSISETVDLCGEAVGRGIRVLALDPAGNPLTTIKMLKLQGFGFVNKVNENLKDLTLTTINPPTSCQQIQFQYQNQNLPTTDTNGSGNPGSKYNLVVYSGNNHAEVTFTLGVNEFKIIRITVP